MLLTPNLLQFKGKKMEAVLVTSLEFDAPLFAQCLSDSLPNVGELNVRFVRYDDSNTSVTENLVLVIKDDPLAQEIIENVSSPEVNIVLI